MPEITIEQGTTAYQQQAEEWRRFNEWAAESRSVSPFGELATHWHAGHLTIEEGKRLEADQKLARFLESASPVSFYKETDW